MADFPANVGTGRVHGTVMQWLVDSADPGSVPDVAPFSTATIKFTPSVKYVMHPASGTIFVPVIGPIEIGVTGEVDVTLIATDDADLNPTGFTYKVEIVVIGGTVAPFNITVPSGSDRLLTELVPVVASTGTLTTQGPAGESAYDVAVRNGFVGTEAQWLAQWVATDGSITRVVSLTQAAYNLLSPPDPQTLYVITS